MSIYVKDTGLPLQACVIWLHGLGADASDMAGLAQQLSLPNKGVRHVFVDAPIRPVTLNGGQPMRAWYDIIGMQLTDREDKEGIEASAALVEKVISDQIQEGLRSTQIFLAGFSQGGALALYISLTREKLLGGVIALSAYLPLASLLEVKQPHDLPFFIAGGDHDPLVLPAWTQFTIEWLKAKGFQKISQHQYPMEHSVCLEEIDDLSNWLQARLREETK